MFNFNIFTHLHSVTLLLLHCSTFLFLHNPALSVLLDLAFLPTLGLQETLLRHLEHLSDQGTGLPVQLGWGTREEPWAQGCNQDQDLRNL